MRSHARILASCVHSQLCEDQDELNYSCDLALLRLIRLQVFEEVKKLFHGL